MCDVLIVGKLIMCLALVLLCACAGVTQGLFSDQGLASLVSGTEPRKMFWGSVEDLIKVAVRTCEAFPIEVASLALPVVTKSIEVNVYSKSGRRIYNIRSVDKILSENKRIYTGKTYIYLPGWRNGPDDESSRTIIQALLAKDMNVLLIDSCEYTCKGYVQAATSIRGLGQILHEFIKQLVRRGVPINQIVFVGFSLGAHTAGLAGRMYYKDTGVKFEKITALDPAKPCFATTKDFRLTKTDAKFVEVFHTNPGVLGLKNPIGHVDIYANGPSGKHPECKGRRLKLDCDHSLSWKLYALSVNVDSGMQAYFCRDWAELASNSCSGRLTALGFGTSIKNRGLFNYKSTLRRGTRQIRRHAAQSSPLDFWRRIMKFFAV